MQSLVKSTYTEAEVIKALEASGRSVKFRYELLDQNLAHKGWLDSVESGKVENNHMAQVKRTGNFTMRSQNVWDINFLVDRIRPWFDLLIGAETIDQPISSSTVMAHGSFVLPNDRHDLYTDGVAPTSWSPAPDAIGSDPVPPYSSAWTREDDGQHYFQGINKTVTTGMKLIVWFMVPSGSTATGVQVQTQKNGIWGERWHVGDEPYGPGSVKLGEIPQANRWQAFIIHLEDEYVAGDSVTGIAFSTRDAVSGTAGGGPVYFDSAVFTTGSIYQQHNLPKTVDEWISWPLGTFLMETSSELTNTEGTKRSVKGFDQLLILKEDSFTNRYSIPKNVSIRDKVIEIIESAGILNHSISSSGALTPFALEWPIGTPKLEVVNELLRAMGFGSLLFTAAGVAAAQPWQSALDRGPQYEYLAKIISPDVEVKLDIARVPNQWVGYTSSSDGPSLRSVFTNTNPNSFTSTVNRGRVVSAAPIRATAADQAALDTIVRQKAEADSQIYQETSFTSVKMPHHGDGDILRLKADHAFVDFVAQEKSWGMDLEVGGVMEHTIQRLITL